jgi:hypothetical protein
MRRAFYWSTALVTLGFQTTQRLFNSRPGDLFYAYDGAWRAPMIQQNAHTNMFSQGVLPHEATISCVRLAIPEVIPGELLASGEPRTVSRETLSLFLQQTRLSFLVGACRVVDTVLVENTVALRTFSDMETDTPELGELRAGYTDAAGTYHLRIEIPANALVRQQEYVRVELETASTVRPTQPMVVIGMLEGIERARVD